MPSDPPTLDAYSINVDGSRYWIVYCEHCRIWHRHGPMEGHRIAHCTDPESPWYNCGYELRYAGAWGERN